MRFKMTLKFTDWIKVIGSALAFRYWEEMGAFWEDYSSFSWDLWE